MGVKSMDIDEFLRINSIVMDRIRQTPTQIIQQRIQDVNKGNSTILIQIDLAKKLANTSSDIVLREVITRRAYIGACAMMFMHPQFVDELVSESEVIDAVALSEKKIVKIAGLKGVEEARTCLQTFFYDMLLKRMGSYASYKNVPECTKYYQSGVMPAHLGVLIHETRRVDIGSISRVREFVYNQIVTWFLEVMRNISYGSMGAGEIGMFGAHVGRGKTTTVFYSIKSALMSIGFDESKAEEYASKLIILDPDLTLDVMEAILLNETKVPFLIIDNASSAFPKHWVQLGGNLMKRYIRFNKILANIRALSGITLFIPNAPTELASFIRSASTLRIKGYKINYVKFDGSVFELDKEVPSTEIGKNVTKADIIASIFIYPLLKLPEQMYNLDREEKTIVSRHEIEAIKSEERSARANTPEEEKEEEESA
jgi:hypothetical protein